MDQSRSTLDVDTILELLSHYHRRTVLRTLSEHTEDVVEFDVVIDELAAIESDEGGDSVEESKITSTLLHQHCPKLREAGIIDYDVRSDEIRYYGNERIEIALELITELEATLKTGQ